MMKTHKLCLILAPLLVVAFFGSLAPVFAHHGSAISYDMSKSFTMKAVVTEWKYINPHPTLFFDVTDEKGNVAHWHSELGTQPSWMLRAGWTKRRTEEVLKPGTVVTVTLWKSKVAENSGLVTTILNEKGEEVVTGAATAGGTGTHR